MEQKRTLWIIAAAGMFLLVVLGAAFILYSPAQKRGAQTVAQVTTTPVQTQQVPVVSSGWNLPPAYDSASAGTVQLPPPPVNPYENKTINAGELTVYSENTVVYDKNGNGTEATVIDLNALKYAAEKAENPEPYPQNINITVNIPETKYEPAPVVAQVMTPVSVTTQTVEAPVTTKVIEKQVTKAVAVPERTQAPEKATPAPKTTAPAVSAPKTTAPAPVKVAATTSAKTAETKVAEKKMDQFWVQAAAFSNKKSAESARSVLDENKIPADIFTYQDAKGKVFYRVRVGPYTTKSEAEYWRTRIVKISDFSKGESYITSN